jgi:hypothetical protein
MFSMPCSLRLPSMLGSPAQQVFTSPLGLMCRPRQGAAQKKSFMNYLYGFSPVRKGLANHKRNHASLPGWIFFLRWKRATCVPVFEMLLPDKGFNRDLGYTPLPNSENRTINYTSFVWHHRSIRGHARCELARHVDSVRLV